MAKPNLFSRSQTKPSFLLLILSAGVSLFLFANALYWVASIYRGELQNWQTLRPNNDPVTQWQARLERIKQDLPASGVVGYISEQDMENMPFDAVDSDEEFVITQYSLAPLVLDRGNAQHAYVIGNFNITPDEEALLEPYFGVKMIGSYGMGIYLFAGEEP